MYCIALQKILPPKSLRLLNFLNLSHAREARGTPQNQWLLLEQAQQDFQKLGLVPCMVRRGGFEPP
jgi:hypothetical protein